MKNKEEILLAMNNMRKNTLMETLEISYVDCGEDYLVATMPVNARVHQPDGILNGGATLALAESIGSPASLLVVDYNKFMVRGIQMSANHIRSVSEGLVTATATFQHIGRSTHIIDIRIEDEQKRLISMCKLTNMIIPRK